jgi:transcriptional regulator with XRE-family HTH domain
MPKSIHKPEAPLLGELLREMREKTVLNQTELGARFGRSQSYISGVELGKKVPDVLELRDHCAALKQDFVRFVSQLEKRIASRIVRKNL